MRKYYLWAYLWRKQVPPLSPKPFALFRRLPSAPTLASYGDWAPAKWRRFHLPTAPLVAISTTPSPPTASTSPSTSLPVGAAPPAGGGAATSAAGRRSRPWNRPGLRSSALAAAGTTPWIGWLAAVSRLVACFSCCFRAQIVVKIVFFEVVVLC